MKNNPIPADQARWSVYSKLAQDNQRYLWGILDGLAKRRKAATPPSRRSATTSAPAWTRARSKRGAAPLQALFRPDRAHGLDARPAARAGAPAAGAGRRSLFFGFSSSQDFGDSTRVIAFATAAAWACRTATIT
jgi:putative endopeptidase